jgi:hypothetical protein
MLELAGTPSDKYFQEWAATKRQRLQELLGAKGLHADELINQFLLHLPTSRKIILKSSNRFGYQIDHDGKYEKYFSSNGEGAETWRRGDWSSPRGWVRLSAPLYDSKTGIALIYIGATYHLLSGTGDILVYKIDGETVTEIGRINVWIA